MTIESNRHYSFEWNNCRMRFYMSHVKADKNTHDVTPEVGQFTERSTQYLEVSFNTLLPCLLTLQWGFLEFLKPPLTHFLTRSSTLSLSLTHFYLTAKMSTTSKYAAGQRKWRKSHLMIKELLKNPHF